jgi:hypothetical protein
MKLQSFAVTAEFELLPGPPLFETGDSLILGESLGIEDFLPTSRRLP